MRRRCTEKQDANVPGCTHKSAQARDGTEHLVETSRKVVVRLKIGHERVQPSLSGATPTIVDYMRNHNSERSVDVARDGRHCAVRCLLLLALCSAIAACSIAPPPADNAKALQDIALGRSGSEEVVEGTVTRVLPASNGPSGVHERFYVALKSASPSVPLYVTDNISIASAAPLHPGDHVIVKGELAFNSYGPLLHWTHRDPRLRHAPGFVEVGGQIYE